MLHKTDLAINSGRLFVALPQGLFLLIMHESSGSSKRFQMVCANIYRAPALEKPKARLGRQALKVGARRLASTVTVLTPATNSDWPHSTNGLTSSQFASFNHSEVKLL
jgi:hypothetical protein